MSRFHSRRRNASRTRRHHYNQELSSAAAVRKCQEQHRGERDADTKPVTQPKPSQPTFEFQMTITRKAITEPGFPLPAFDAESMTDEQLCLYLFDNSGPVGSSICNAYIAWNKGVWERTKREWQEQEAQLAAA